MPKIVDESTIYRAAINVLMSRGYEGATTREIAALSEVNEATLFRRYGSKSNLLARAIECQLSDTPLNHLAYSGDLQSDITAIVEAYVETYQIHGDFVLILIQEVPRNPDLRPASEVLLRNLQPALGLLRRYQVEGKLKPEAPLAALVSLIGSVMLLLTFGRSGIELGIPDLDASAYAAAYLKGRAAE